MTVFGVLYLLWFSQTVTRSEGQVIFISIDFFPFISFVFVFHRLCVLFG